MLRFVFPTTTTRVGANARQISSITRLVNDLPPPRANGCSKINGGNSSHRVADLGAGKFGQFEVALDRVFAPIHFDDAAVKEARAFAAVAHSINLFRATDPRDECAP